MLHAASCLIQDARALLTADHGSQVLTSEKHGSSSAYNKQGSYKVTAERHFCQGASEFLVWVAEADIQSFHMQIITLYLLLFRRSCL